MRRRAFTLIEVMVVTTVLVVIAGLITPNFVAMKQGRDRDEEYNSVLRLAQRGREAAIQGGRTYELTVGGNSTLVLQREKAAQTGDDPRQTQPGAQPDMENVDQVALNGDVTLGDMRLADKDSGASGFTLHFYPDGTSEGGGIELDYNGTKRNVSITTRGLASLNDGGLPPAAENDWEAGQYVQRTSS